MFNMEHYYSKNGNGQPKNMKRFLPASYLILNPFLVSVPSEMKLMYISGPVETTGYAETPVSVPISVANELSPSYTYT